MSALTNVVLAVVVARSVNAAGFGAFAVAFLAFSIMVGIERALVAQPMSIRHSGATGPQLQETTAAALGTVVALAAPAGLVAVIAGLTVGGFLGPALIALGVTLPGLLLQDACRLLFIARGAPRRAAANDALWAVVQFATIATLVVSGHAHVWALVLAWGGAAGVCVVVALAQLHVRPRPSAGARWAREHRDLVGYLLAEYLLTTGAFSGGILLVGGFIGLGSVGAVRGAQVLLGPLGIVGTAMMSFALPEMSRRTDLSNQAKWRAAATISIFMMALSLTYTTVLLVMPDQVGMFLFRASWQGASSVLLPIALGSTAAGAALGPALMIYALGHASKTFRLTVVEAPLVLIAMLTGGWLGGIQGAAWGICADQVSLVPLWFLQLWWILNRTHDHSPGSPPTPSDRFTAGLPASAP